MVNMLPGPLGILYAAGSVLKSYGVDLMEGYVQEHGSVGVDASIGLGVAADVDVGFSKQGVTIFGGLGVGLGVDFSLNGNYDFQNASGFTSKTSVYSSFGSVPVQVGASVIVSETGPAFSVGVEGGEGVDIESVVGYTTTIPW